MTSMVRTMVRLFISVAAAAILPTAPSYAENFATVSAAGSGNTCTPSAPCASISAALLNLSAPFRIVCVNGAAPDSNNISFGAAIDNKTVDIDCPLGFEGQLTFPSFITNTTVRLRHLGFRNLGLTSAITFDASGTLILEDCVFADSTGVSLDIEPSGPLNIVLKNSRISNSGSGILLKPAAGGSINATFDHVTITQNSGGGLKIDTTNGPVTVDITDSVVSKNAGNGINAVGNADGQAMVSIKNSVIAKNGVAGIQANGANVGLLVHTTLFDQNVAGATSIVGGGRISTYGNNSIVGSAGSGFTGSAPLQ